MQNIQTEINQMWAACPPNNKTVSPEGMKAGVSYLGVMFCLVLGSNLK